MCSVEAPKTGGFKKKRQEMLERKRMVKQCLCGESLSRLNTEMKLFGQDVRGLISKPTGKRLRKKKGR